MLLIYPWSQKDIQIMSRLECHFCLKEENGSGVRKKGGGGEGGGRGGKKEGGLWVGDIYDVSPSISAPP